MPGVIAGVVGSFVTIVIVVWWIRTQENGNGIDGKKQGPGKQ